jgi:hypothetical protein
LEKDVHRDVGNAAETQLDRFYTSDPESVGFGIDGVFCSVTTDEEIASGPWASG